MGSAVQTEINHNFSVKSTDFVLTSSASWEQRVKDCFRNVLKFRLPDVFAVVLAVVLAVRFLEMFDRSTEISLT